MSGTFLALVRGFALPVLVVFGGLGVSFGVVGAISASQGEHDYSFDDGSSGSDSGDASDGTVDEATDPGEGTVTEGEGEAPPVPSSLPASCADAFSESLKTTIQANGLELNPSWAQGSESYGLTVTDPTLRDQLAGLPQLECRWLNGDGGGEIGIETTIAVVTPSEASAVNSRLASLGYTPLSELGGVRYVWEKKATEISDRYGESHIVLGDLWFCTHWLSYGPTGYTADVVTTVLG